MSQRSATEVEREKTFLPQGHPENSEYRSDWQLRRGLDLVEPMWMGLTVSGWAVVKPWKALSEERWDALHTCILPTCSWTKPAMSWSPQLLWEERWDALLVFTSPAHCEASRNLVPQFFVWDSVEKYFYTVASHINYLINCYNILVCIIYIIIYTRQMPVNPVCYFSLLLLNCI